MIFLFFVSKFFRICIMNVKSSIIWKKNNSKKVSNVKIVLSFFFLAPKEKKGEKKEKRQKY